MKRIISTQSAPKPVGPYSQAVNVDRFLFVSGQIAIDPKEGKIVASDVRTQTIRVLENIKAILEAANYSLSDVVQITVYLSSMSLFKDFNAAYAEYFGEDFPARATVGVELVPGALVELSAVAYKE